ncbi:MAG: lactonase family protein [Gemmatimonadota bacterium]|nr:lactonase family protein [Gemmatimonadota bacterium]
MTTDHPLSRRGFLGATALGAAGLWRGLATPRAASLHLFVGTYTENGRRNGVYLLRMNAETGALSQVAAADVGPNPSFLSLSPAGRVLYAVNEVEEMSGIATGAVRAYAIDTASGALTLIDEQPSGGAAPCYVSSDRSGRFALVANYSGGTVAIFPIVARGALGKASQVVQQSGTGPVTDRQEKAHAHCVIPHPSNRFVMAADLGADRVFVYRLERKRGTLRHELASDAVLPPGTGPRHLAFHPHLPILFVTGELNSTVTALRCEPRTGALTLAQTISTLPSGWTGQNFPADVHVAANGRTLYASNRGHNSVAVFSITASGMLAFQQAMPTGGDWPRNFSLDPTGRWLLVANQRSHSVVVFATDEMTGRLTATDQRIELPSPVCVRFQA